MFIKKQIELFSKKGIDILDSNVWRSNFFKDVTNICYEDYHGSPSIFM